MIKDLNWEQDAEYVALISDILATDAVQQLAQYPQHHYSNRLEHSLSVSYRSYKLGKKMHLDTRALARAGLLHDLFYYDWRTTKFDLGTHAYIHPRIALRNAEKITELSKLEKDIIVKHMWGATLALPKYKESWVVNLVDDYCAMDEVIAPFRQRMHSKVKRALHLGTSK